MLADLLVFFTNYGYFAVFGALIICGLGVPVPEDITLLAGGAICGLANNALNSATNVHVMVIVSILGVLVGDGCMFYLGARLGHKVTKVPFVRRFITPKNYSKIQNKINKHGVKILFFARFLPGMRAGIFLTVGISKRVSIWKFLALDGLAALISVPLLVYLGYYFANDLDKAVIWIDKGRYVIITVIVLLLLGWLINYWIKRKKQQNNNSK